MLKKLLERATGGLELEINRFFEPSMFYRLLIDPFSVWCDYHAPKSEAVEEISRYEQIKMDREKKFEEKWIKENYPEAVKIEPEQEIEALINTLEAMVEGAPAIHGAQLWLLRDEMYGQADLLVLSHGKSDLGTYHYKVKEIERSKITMVESHIYQGAIYNRMLGAIQGYLPESYYVVTPSRETGICYEDYSGQPNKLLAEWRRIRDGEYFPDIQRLEYRLSPWRVYANKLILERMDLTLLSDVNAAMRHRLKVFLNVERIEDLYCMSLEELRARLKDEIGEKIYYSVQAYRENKPILQPGQSIDIPRGRKNIHFGFETSDDLHETEPPHTFLIGLWDEEKGEYVYFLGEGEKDEERIYREFLDYVGDPEGCCLFHWGDFEITVLKKVADKYPILTERLNALMGSCISEQAVVKSKVHLPVSYHSIRNVASLFGSEWRREDVDAMEIMVLYWEWLEGGDWDKIQKVLEYNEDDVRAMARVCEKLRELAVADSG